MDKSDPTIHDDNPPMDAAFIAGMEPSRRGRRNVKTPEVETIEQVLETTASQCKSVFEALAPPVPHDFDWEPDRSGIASRVPDFYD